MVWSRHWVLFRFSSLQQDVRANRGTTGPFMRMRIAVRRRYELSKQSFELTTRQSAEGRDVAVIVMEADLRLEWPLGSSYRP